MSVLRRIRRNLVPILCVILAVCALGALTSGFTKWRPSDIKNNLTKERNDANLIATSAITLEDGKSTTSDVTYKVDKNGVVTLSGKATADEQITYATVTLAAGKYTFTGAEGGSNKTYTMGLIVGSNFIRSDGEAITISSAGTYTIAIRVYENANFFNVKLLPVLVKGEEAADFYK